MKINSIDYRSLRNEEHFLFNTESINLIDSAGAVNLKIEMLMPAYRAAFVNEDKALKKILKSAKTEKIDKADKQRDTTYRGLTNLLRAALDHFNPDVVDAAKRIKIVFDTYGNLSRMSMNTETASIYNILEDLKSPEYMRDAEIVQIVEWIDQLKLDNDALEALVRERNDEIAAKTQLKVNDCRTETDKAYHNIVERINAAIIIEGETPYADFVSKLNAFIERYNNAMAQRTGKHHKL